MRKLFNWARLTLAGQVAIVAVSIYMHWWMVPLVTDLAPFIGGWLFWLINNTQHSGLKDNTDDFRECVRTVYLNPFFQFLYWHMNYHTEHHMYAAVPCYRLGALHRLIKADMPECPRGLYAAWKQIFETQKKQAADPTYQFVPPDAAATCARIGHDRRRCCGRPAGYDAAVGVNRCSSHQAARRNGRETIAGRRRSPMRIRRA